MYVEAVLPPMSLEFDPCLNTICGLSMLVETPGSTRIFLGYLCCLIITKIIILIGVVVIVLRSSKLVVQLTNRFHVAVHLFSNRSQVMSKCGKNKKVAHEAQPSVSLMFLPHFDVLCDLLPNRRTASWNL